MPRVSKKQQAEIDEADAQYWQALGQFIEAFSLAEYFLFYLLSEQAKVHYDVGKAIFSGTRSEVAMQYIERIWQIRDPGELVRKELETVFAQMRAINNVRNIAVHHHSIKTKEGRIVTTSRTALTPARVKEARISSRILGEMCADLKKINVHLIGRTWKLKKDRESAGLKRRAWRYKPPPNQNQSAKKLPRKDRD